MTTPERQLLEDYTRFADETGLVWECQCSSEALAELRAGGIDLTAELLEDPERFLHERFVADPETFAQVLRALCLPWSAEVDDFPGRLRHPRVEVFAGVAAVAALALAFPDNGYLVWFAGQADKIIEASFPGE